MISKDEWEEFHKHMLLKGHSHKRIMESQYTELEIKKVLRAKHKFEKERADILDRLQNFRDDHGYCAVCGGPYEN